MLDGSEVDALARQLTTAPYKVLPALVPVAHVAGNKIKAGLRSQASGHRGMGGLVGGIEYKVEVTPSSVGVETGWFNPVGQQHLENIAAFGTSRSAPVMDILQPLNSEVDPFIRHAAKAAVETLL